MGNQWRVRCLNPVLFLDECLGTKDVADRLRSVGATVEVLVDHFASGCPDEEWLPKVGDVLRFAGSSSGPTEWVVLTKDKWIRRRPAERAALENAGVAAFVLTTKDLSGAGMGEAFANAYPRIRRTLRNYEPPFVAAVDRSGSVELLTDAPRRGAVRRGRIGDGS